MATSREKIEGWLNEMYSLDFSHMIVATDTFDYSDYPVYILKGADVRDKLKELERQSMTKIMEVYSNKYTFEDQMKEHRAYHLD